MRRTSRWLFFVPLTVVLAACGAKRLRPVSPEAHTRDLREEEQPLLPNFVYIYADDLGYNELGSYGQRVIKTPNLDKMAEEGMRFTQHYAGSAVCAPSRCSLLTGRDSGHCAIRGNAEVHDKSKKNPLGEGQRALADANETLAEVLKKRGYRSAAIGKWGLGAPDSEGHPNAQGFDEFFGYLCQREAHNYYPDHLWENDQWFELERNPRFSAHQTFPEGVDPNDADAYLRYRGKQYSPDLFTERALNFLEDSKVRKQPFFLYLAYSAPHVSLQVPDEELAVYEGRFDEEPYLGERGYLPHPRPLSAYAAMISRLDKDVGRVLAKIEELELDENTLVIFSSDNGPAHEGGADPKNFSSAGRLRGYKRSLHEGGIRVPMIAWWPGKVPAGVENDMISAQWDILPTVADFAEIPEPPPGEGLSLKNTLLGKSTQSQHDFLYWEFVGAGGQRAVRFGKWKAYQGDLLRDPNAAVELYDLEADIGETTDLARKHPELVLQAREYFKQREHSDNPDWEFFEN